MLLTLPIREVLPATARASLVRLDVRGESFPFAAGQALTIAAHGQTPRRPYSIASSPDEVERTGSLELLVGLGDDGTPGPHLRLEPGARVDIEGPVGGFTFPEHPVDVRFLFIAGGTGIAPLRAMLRQALSRGLTNLGVLYSARTPDDFAYEQELRDLAERRQIELRLTVTRVTDAAWSGGRGRIDSGQIAPLLHDPLTLCFVCGPRTLVDAVPKALRALGVAADRIRLEEW